MVRLQSTLQSAGARSQFILIGLILIGSVHAGPLAAQQLDIRTSRGVGSYLSYHQWNGLSVAYDHHFKSGTKFEVCFNYSWTNKPYTLIHTKNNYDTGTSKTYMERRNPENQRYSAQYMIGWNPVNNQKAAIYWGPLVSLNWMHILEQNHRYETKWFEDAVYFTEFWRNKKLGFGWFLEFEIKEIICRQLSAAVRLHSEWIGFNGLFSVNPLDPGFISWSGVDIGLKWNFGK